MIIDITSTFTTDRTEMTTTSIYDNGDVRVSRYRQIGDGQWQMVDTTLNGDLQ